MKENKEKGFLTFKEVEDFHQKQPPEKFLWNGITEGSTGIVFGPSKSGKTTLCECLAMSLCVGKPSFLDFKLDTQPKKIIFLGLEEHWKMRAGRNRKQKEGLTETEKELYGENYLYQPYNYTKTVTTPKDWKQLEQTIKSSGADVAFIDSITRLNHGDLSKGNDAALIMQRLKEICHKLGITIICIHHTPKIGNNPLTMDAMKGSSTFAQEADFIIGVRKTYSGRRYLKNVEFRYCGFEEGVVYEFRLSERVTTDFVGKATEYELLEQSDGRRADNNREHIIKLLNNMACKKISTKDLVFKLKPDLGIQERQIKSLLSELVASKLIKRPKKGFYLSLDCSQKPETDEEE